MGFEFYKNIPTGFYLFYPDGKTWHLGEGMRLAVDY
jgi:hypothetical protein